MEEGIAGGLSWQEAVNCATQVAAAGDFESKHFWRLTFNCKNAHIFDKKKTYPLPVFTHDMFKLFLAAGGNQTFTIYWVCKATNLMENIFKTHPSCDRNELSTVLRVPEVADSARYV